MKGLKDKRILFFAPNFFGYDLEIKKKLESYGAIVDHYNERPSTNFIIKATIRVYKKLIRVYIDRYFNKIIAKNQAKDYHIIFIIKGEVFNRDIIEKLKKNYPNAKLILYLWDSIKNYKEIKDCLPLFDKTLTFDLNDSKEIETLLFRPLFYLDDFKNCQMSSVDRDIDLLFIGTVHSDRWLFLKKLKDQAEGIKLKVYYYLYIQSPILYFIRKIFDKRLRTMPFKDIQFYSISKSRVIELINKTKVIIDIQHPKQTGLTMRAIEILGAKRKLITTNQAIKEYDFYSENNTFIIDRDDPIINSDFWNSKYEELSEEMYEKYSINGWIKDIFNDYK